MIMACCLGNQCIGDHADRNIMVQIILDSTEKLVYFKKETADVAVPIICILVQLFSIGFKMDFMIFIEILAFGIKFNQMHWIMK